MQHVETAPAILVVEDDDLVQSFLCRALAGLAGEVSARASGGAALDALEHADFGLVLLDGLLPDVHGIEVAKQILGGRRGGTTAVCFVSGMLRHPQPMRCGISALPKPLRVRELLSAATELLEWRRMAASSTSLADRLVTLDQLAADLLVS